MLLIGSQALKFYGQEYLCPEVKRTWDTDFIATYDEFQKFKNLLPGNKKIIPLNRGKSIALISKQFGIFEFEIAWQDSISGELLSLVKENNLSKLVDDKNNIYVASPDVIFTLKKSHRFLRNSPHFLKTMRDYKWLRDQCGSKVPEVLDGINWFKQRTDETYWYKHPKLDVTKDEFFNDDGIKYVYDHDSIHISVSNIVIDGQKTPAYTLYKDDQSEVKCDKNKFNALPELYKLYGVLEEAYVLAIERSQVPFPGIWTPHKSFTFALDKVCSSITSGWFREFAWENYDKVVELYNDNYVDKFWDDVKSGIVKPFTGKKY
jgi:hypothetical protein